MPVSMNDYQSAAAKTALYRDKDGELTFPREAGLSYACLGLVSEAGEVASLWKKAIRDEDGSLSPERLGKLEDELGDVLWYVAEIATQCGFDLGEIALHNLAKLKSRQQRNTLRGDGDDR